MAVVDLERTIDQVAENVGVVEVCTVVSSPRIECPVAFLFEVILSTSDGDAGNLCIRDGVAVTM